MVEDRSPSDRRAHRPPKSTPAERRERRGAVEDPAEVLDAGARFLEARPRSIDEVRRKLGRDGYREDLVDAAVIRLQDLRYLDDDAFARAWIESRDRARPRGEHALRRELELKGVERSLVDAVLDDRRVAALARSTADGGGDGEPSSPDDAAAERLLRRKMPALLREADPRRRRQRAYGLLARSGFSPDVCNVVSRRVAEEASDPGDADDGPEGT
jgi:regulatory protein